MFILCPYSDSNGRKLYVKSKNLLDWHHDENTAAVCGHFLLAFPVLAQNDSSKYVFLLASGFLCDPGDSSTCPARAKANQGDSYELSGAGTFHAQNRSVEAAGTYAHHSPNGNVLETGVWFASELMKFDSYGTSPGALYGKRFGVGLLPLAHDRLLMSRGLTDRSRGTSPKAQFIFAVWLGRHSTQF